MRFSHEYKLSPVYRGPAKLFRLRLQPLHFGHPSLHSRPRIFSSQKRLELSSRTLCKCVSPTPHRVYDKCMLGCVWRSIFLPFLLSGNISYFNEVEPLMNSLVLANIILSAHRVNMIPVQPKPRCSPSRPQAVTTMFDLAFVSLTITTLLSSHIPGAIAQGATNATCNSGFEWVSFLLVTARCWPYKMRARRRSTPRARVHV